MRDFRDERTVRAGIREERLRATAGLASTDAISSWRGASGRRYVVGVHALIGTGLADVAEAVVLAVRRQHDGVAEVVDVAAPAADTSRRARLRWLAFMRARGATEMHVHLLAGSVAEREAVRQDLAADAAATDAARSIRVRA